MFANSIAAGAHFTAFSTVLGMINLKPKSAKSHRGHRSNFKYIRQSRPVHGASMVQSVQNGCFGIAKSTQHILWKPTRVHVSGIVEIDLYSMYICMRICRVARRCGRNVRPKYAYWCLSVYGRVCTALHNRNLFSMYVDDDEHGWPLFDA